MKNQMAPNISLVIVLLAAVGAVARRAAARRPEPQGVHGPRPAPGPEMAKPQTPRSRPATTVEQAQHIFHDLHAEGRNTLCAVCDIQYGPKPRLST
jgi:hypothetical protein